MERTLPNNFLSNGKRWNRSFTFFVGVFLFLLGFVPAVSFAQDDPASFTANAVSDIQIDLLANPNSNNDNIVVVYNLTGIFSNPTNTIAPTDSGTTFQESGDIIIYNGPATKFSHTALIPNTQYFYKAFFYDLTNNYSEGVTANATTKSSSTCTTPGTPGAITGPSSVCPGATDTYTIDPVNGATSYNWSVPSDWTITDGQGKTSITVTAGALGGTISVTAENSCGVSEASKLTVSIKFAPSIILSSETGTDAQSKCINISITDITYVINHATGASVTGLPAGVDGSYASGVFTISGKPTQTGIFNYTITTTGGCGSTDATGTITVNPNSTITLSSNAGTDAQSKCINSTITDISYLITDATGATVSGLPAGVTGSYDATTKLFTISGKPTESGLFSYTVTPTGDCGNAKATGTITVNPNSTITLSSNTGTDAQSKCINSTITDISYLITDATGATVSGLPAGVTGSYDATTKLFTISGKPTESGLFSYTVTPTGDCGNAKATGTITVNPNSTITLSSNTGTDAQSKCINSTIADISYLITDATGATVSGLPAGLTGSYDATTKLFTISGKPTESGVFSYTVTPTGDCGNSKATGTITVKANNTVGAASSTPTVCINTALASITHTTTGATGIGTATGLPAGVTASFASNTITISGTPTASGTFNYSIPLTGGCGTVNATGTITVTANNTAGAPSSSPTLCINTVMSPNITIATTGATGIGTATGLPAGVTAAFASNTITISGTPTASGTFNYSIPLIGGCGTVSATGTITVTPNNTAAAPSSSPTICINTALLPNITIATTGATGIGTATGLPAGVTASFASNTITISGTPTASGTFNYSIPLTGGCGTVNATGTITVKSNNTVGAASSTPTVCINTALASITHTTTGATAIGTATGLPAGVTASFASNTITISGTPTASGTFNYSIPLTGGCGTVNATGTITVKANNTVGAASSTPTVCINTALASITHTTTGATAIGTATGLPAGVTTSFASNTITISGTPTASGTFNYSIPLTGGCGTVSATGTITVNAAPTTATVTTTPLNYCGTLVSGSLGGNTPTVGTGAWSKVSGPGTVNFSASSSATSTATVSVAGTYVFRWTISNGSCTPSTADVTVNYGTAPTAPTGTGGETCGTGSVDISATSSGNTINWYNALTGALITNTASGATFSTGSISTTTVYYAESVSSVGSCVSSTRTPVVAVVTQTFTPTITTAPTTAICLGQFTTLTASGFGTLDTIVGGDFDQANPAGWRVNGGSTNFPASANNNQPNNWAETNGSKFVGIGGDYASQLPGKFAIASATANPLTTTLETPIFKSIGKTADSLEFYQAFTLSAGTVAKIEISTDGGNNYNKVLVQYNGPLTMGIPNGGFAHMFIPLTDYLGQSNLRIRYTFNSPGNSVWAIDYLKRASTFQPVTYTWSSNPPGFSGTGSPVTVTPTASGSNTYTLTTKVGNCPATTTTTTSITVNPLPTITPSSSAAPVCVRSTVQTTTLAYTATNTPTTYSITWNTSPSNSFAAVTNTNLSASPITISVPANTAAGTYTGNITVTNANGCASNASVPFTVTINPTPTVTTSNTANICSGSSPNIGLTASIPSTFTWTIGTISGGITGASAGSGSTINQTLNNPNPTAGTVQYIVTPTATTGSCPGAPYTITVNVNPAPAVTTPNAISTCSGSGPNIALTASIPSTFTWTIGTTSGGITGASAGSGSTINQILTNPNPTAGTVQYIVTPTATTGSCPGAPYTITVTVNPKPTVTTPNTASTCTGSGPNITLAANVPSTFTWTIGTVTGGITGASAASGSTINQILNNSNATAGTVQYIVTPTATTGSCPGAPYAITVTVNPTPTVNTPNTASTCSGSAPNIGLTASSPSSFTWTIGTITGAITGATAGSGSIINQILTNANGTSGTVQYIVTPTSTTGSCPGAPYTITVTVNLNTWIGSITSNDWNTGSNWCSGNVPTATTDAIIPAGLPISRYPVLSAAGAAKSLVIENGAKVVLNDQTLTVESDVSGQGIITGSMKSGLVLNGTSTIGTLYYDQTTTDGNKLNNLTINKGTATLGNDLFVYGVVAPNSGTLNSNGHLTLGSSSIKNTARVAEVASAGTISGDVTVERFIPEKRSFRFISPSVTTSGSIKTNWMEGAVNPGVYSINNPHPGFGTNITGNNPTANGFDPTITNNPSLFTFNNSTQNWVAVPDTKNSLSAGYAYRMMVRGSRSTEMWQADNNPTPSNTILRATGQLFTGTMTYSSTPNAVNGLALNGIVDKYSMIGNPYASPVDFEDMIKMNSSFEVTGTANNIKPEYTVWDPRLNKVRGGYVTYNAVLGGTGVTASDVNKNIQSGQAFFVQTTGGNPKIEFNENYKTTGNTAVFRDPSRRTKLSIQLLLNKNGGMENTADGVVAFFDNKFKATIGNEDSYKFTNLDENLAINHDGISLSIEGRPDVTDDDTIRLKMWQFRQKDYYLQLSGSNFSPDLTAFVKDNYLHQQTPIDLSAVTFLPFSITSDSASFAADRFSVVFKPSTTLPVTLTKLKAYQKEEAIQVEWTAEAEINVNQYEVERSMDGQHFVKVTSMIPKGNNSNSESYTWLDQNAGTGNSYYRIKAIEKSGAVKYSNVVKVSIAEIKGSITVFPNPIKGNIITVKMKNMEKGRYNTILFNTLGQRLYSGTIQQLERTATYNISLGRLISKGTYTLQISKGGMTISERIIVE